MEVKTTIQQVKANQFILFSLLIGCSFLFFVPQEIPKD